MKTRKFRYKKPVKAAVILAFILCFGYILYTVRLPFSPQAQIEAIFGMAAVFVFICFAYMLIWLKRPRSPQIFGEAVLKIETKEKIVALTFDDGPDPEATFKMLSTLKKYNAYATFFLTGEHASKYPDIVKKTFMEGHELGNHSFSHVRLIYKTPDFIRKQIQKTDDAIRQTGYDGIIHFRAPWGYKLFFLPHILMKANRKHILWNITLYDWENIPPEKILENLDAEIKPGSIILLHDNIRTAEALELILEQYSGLGYRFVTISQLLESAAH